MGSKLEPLTTAWLNLGKNATWTAQGWDLRATYRVPREHDPAVLELLTRETGAIPLGYRVGMVAAVFSPKDGRPAKTTNIGELSAVVRKLGIPEGCEDQEAVALGGPHFWSWLEVEGGRRWPIPQGIISEQLTAATAIVKNPAPPYLERRSAPQPRPLQPSPTAHRRRTSLAGLLSLVPSAAAAAATAEGDK